MADFLLLAAVEHHQPVVEVAREATPRDLIESRPPVGRRCNTKLLNRDAELKDTEEAGSRHPEGRVTQSLLL